MSVPLHMFPAVSVCICVCLCGCVWNLKQAAVNFSHQPVHGMPEAQVAQLQADTLDVRAEARAYLPLSKQGSGRGDAKCDVGRCMKAQHCWESLLRLGHNHMYFFVFWRIDTLGG